MARGVILACLWLAWALAPAQALAQTGASVEISAPDKLVSGKPAVIRISVRDGDCPRGKAEVSIAKERRAFPWLFVSYLPQGELLRSVLEVKENEAGFSYVFWDEGAYRVRAGARCGDAGVLRGDRLLTVGTPPAKAGATAALLGGALVLGLLSGYVANRMRRPLS